MIHQVEIHVLAIHEVTLDGESLGCFSLVASSIDGLRSQFIECYEEIAHGVEDDMEAIKQLSGQIEVGCDCVFEIGRLSATVGHNIHTITLT